MADERVPTTEVIRAWCRALGSTDEDAARFMSQFDAWLEAHDREVAAKAWDDAWDAADDFYNGPDWATAPINPYRAAELNPPTT